MRNQREETDVLLGQVMRSLRTESDLTQESLADGAGLHRTYIGLIERGDRSPTLRTLFRIATVLDVPCSQIVAMVEGWDG
jgi:transcriptional regulator with XRE-family HTH domain